jgi:hypothetical protein
VSVDVAGMTNDTGMMATYGGNLTGGSYEIARGWRDVASVRV